MKILIVACLLFSGCATMSYVPPLTSTTTNTTVVDSNRDTLWRAFIPALSQNFFVINNLDKDTGLINISYAGDPELFVDCGMLRVDSAGKQWTFPAARAAQYYEAYNFFSFTMINRRMGLEGRTNIIVQEHEQNRARITVNTRYVVTRDVDVRDVNSYRWNSRDTVAFNYAQEGLLPDSGGVFPDAVLCRATGALEKFVLETAEWTAQGRDVKDLKVTPPKPNLAAFPTTTTTTQPTEVATEQKPPERSGPPKGATPGRGYGW